MDRKKDQEKDQFMKEKMRETKENVLKKFLSLKQKDFLKV